MSEYLPLLIGLLFLSGILVTVLYPIFKQRLGWVLSLVPLTIFILLLILLGDIDTQTIKILPSDFSLLPGIDFAFRMDGLSAVFGLLNYRNWIFSGLVCIMVHEKIQSASPFFQLPDVFYGCHDRTGLFG
ncbi:MAG: hypothetical protein U9P82_06440 [Bacteroidota bacterium]|nr:hypothetical protein [Bacteroidota bacterium]